ncbi:hypothetical protein BS17DRAFT_180250 [Gyrodon lividus]|nr:hypothetical protein BS17DRAFT_180250 [Gyrodon lividus]
MAKYTRTLKISSKDLGQEPTLVLTFDKFDKETKGLYDTVLPLVWKATEFGAHGWYNIEETYTSQLAFIRPEVENHRIMGASTLVPIDMNQETVLSKNNEHYEFTTPTAIKGAQDSLPRVVNESGLAENIAIGFMSPDDPDDAIPVLLHKKVGAGLRINAQFNPVLRVYITSEHHHEREILKEQIGKPIWEQDLSGLDEKTTWHLKYDNGVYTITEAD